MKDRFFKSEITSSASTMQCNYNGTTDLYPKRNRNLMNNENSTKAAIKIQRCWRSISLRILHERQAIMELESLSLKEKKLEKFVKRDVSERFWSWFSF